MKKFKADLHIHSVLSPCGDLDASPSRIVEKAMQSGIQILGISDHNCTYHCHLMKELGEEKGLFILPGVEINSHEEIHCLAFFENTDMADDFQGFIDRSLPAVVNEPRFFGQQLIVNRFEHVIGEVDVLLTSALSASIYEVSEEVYKRGGIFIPAHIDRPYTSILSQLGFIPPDLKFDALEVSARFRVSDYRKLHPEFDSYSLITNSDAHHPEAVNRATTLFEMEEISFLEIKKALEGTGGRKTYCQ
jgi:3',5'-nucleoside bisphosphate phosphatase